MQRNGAKITAHVLFSEMCIEKEKLNQNTELGGINTSTHEIKVRLVSQAAEAQSKEKLK